MYIFDFIFTAEAQRVPSQRDSFAAERATNENLQPLLGRANLLSNNDCLA
jgi:hypothetical protein